MVPTSTKQLNKPVQQNLLLQKNILRRRRIIKSSSLTVSLLGTGLGNPKAFADDTESSKSCFLQVWPVVVVNHLNQFYES